MAPKRFIKFTQDIKLISRLEWTLDLDFSHISYLNKYIPPTCNVLLLEIFQVERTPCQPVLCLVKTCYRGGGRLSHLHTEIWNSTESTILFYYSLYWYSYTDNSSQHIGQISYLWQPVGYLPKIFWKKINESLLLLPSQYFTNYV